MPQTATTSTSPDTQKKQMTANYSASSSPSSMETTASSCKFSPQRPPPSNRGRMNSHDIPRTYSGLYGDGNDLLPFELSRNSNTEWLISAGWQLLGTYVTVIFVIHFSIWGWMMGSALSWTISNFLHAMITLVYLHWIKGSPNWNDQGEMNAMTLWEQLESSHATSRARKALLVVPTVLCYLACHFGDYRLDLCCMNIIVWVVAIFPKLPFMNGVRILGINRTTGIDDDDNFKTK